MAETVNIDAVKESPTNPRKRYDSTKLAELERSIATLGVLQPILVRPVNGHFECVFGHRRLRAAKAAGLEVIPAQVRELTDLEVAEAQLIENAQREDIHPLEEGDAFAAVVDTGVMTPEDIALKVGKSRSHVYSRLRLVKLGAKARKAFESGKLTLSVALMLTRVEGKAQDKAVAELVDDMRYNEPVSVGEARRTLRAFTHDLREAPFDAKDAELVPTAGACTTCPKRSGNQTDLFGDIDGDETESCTDSKCFEGKVAANWEQARAKAEAKGLVVLDSKVVFSTERYANDRYAHMLPGYVEAKREPVNAYRLKLRNKSWKALVGKALKPSLVQNPATGEVVEVYDEKAAKKALPADVKAQLKPERSISTSAPSKPKGPKGVDPKQVDALVDARVVQALADQAPWLDEAATLRLELASTEIDSAYSAKLLGWFPDLPEAAGHMKLTAAWRKALPAATVEQLRAVLLVRLWSAYDQAHGVDEAAIRKSVTAELAAQAKAAEAEKKAAAKKPKAAKHGKAKKARKGKEVPE